ncbi:MAG TPA: hypothetical protein VMF51_18070 [Nocardioides sp.]|uniref:hypothetical protein n=1 Tax=Nocardioides sp. TaxID=35761 RepID=UPI002BBCE61D|nr:hypothetical protein [Nocardioides sp.]HTW17042.1 hypothetical protein [Nocardioides sp.]
MTRPWLTCTYPLADGLCGKQAQQFMNARRCPDHTPAKIAGHPEPPTPDPARTMVGLMEAGRRRDARRLARARAAYERLCVPTPVVEPGHVHRWLPRPFSFGPREKVGGDIKYRTGCWCGAWKGPWPPPVVHGRARTGQQYSIAVVDETTVLTPDVAAAVAGVGRLVGWTD